ncbi:reverse transcriptase [Gossypium australe]|uniref:Reverse transcriptase n=1 Tax=Gossypium australe TaxID=47621 RepID=A0A5B6X367_9ROSI|nr:reverse transcriptase [Gossypium australe]
MRCMNDIFADMLEEALDIFLDDFSVYGDSFQECLDNFEKVLKNLWVIKEKLISAPIITTLNWLEPFIVMYNVRDYAVGAVLGQKRNNTFGAILYASKMLIQHNAITLQSKKKCWRWFSLVKNSNPI